MRAAPGDRGLPFLALDLRPGFSGRASSGVRTGAVGSRVNSAPFPQLRGADAPPLVQPQPGAVAGEEGLQCIETEDDQYSTRWYDACWRVEY